MVTASSKNLPLRFGVFELDLNTGELRKSGRAVKLRPQAAKVLGVLASRPGNSSRAKTYRSSFGDKRLSLTLNTALICASGRSGRHWATMPLLRVMWRHCLDKVIDSSHRFRTQAKRKHLGDIV